MSKIEEISKEISTQVSKPEVERALLATTFKGLAALQMRKAMMEGMMRGFEFKDFLEKNVYAIPFRDGYSLVTSVDYARKIGMRSGVVGTSAPTYEEKDGKLIACTVTVKRKIQEHIGEYSATVYFDEYTTGKNLWATKPRTMIAKVAEMHALRKACPEELSKAYAEEEMQVGHKAPTGVVHATVTQVEDVSEYRTKLEGATNSEELKNIWADLPIAHKQALVEVKEKMKKKFEVVVEQDIVSNPDEPVDHEKPPFPDKPKGRKKAVTAHENA